MYFVVISRNNFVLLYLPTSVLIHYIEIIYFIIIKQCNSINFALCNMWLKINDKSVLLFLYIVIRHCPSRNGNIGHTRHGTKINKTKLASFVAFSTHISLMMIHDQPFHMIIWQTSISRASSILYMTSWWAAWCVYSRRPSPVSSSRTDNAIWELTDWLY